MKDEMTIPISTGLFRLRIDPTKLRFEERTRTTLLRWMQRSARQVGKFVNEPSLTWGPSYEPSTRETHLYASADLLPDWAPRHLAHLGRPADFSRGFSGRTNVAKATAFIAKSVNPYPRD